MTENPKLKTTKAHFELFQKECAKWIQAFHLNEWEVSYIHREDLNNVASVGIDDVARVVVVLFSTDWTGNLSLNNDQIKIAAFHEVCEILLHPLVYLGERRYLMADEIEPATHTIIHRLQNAIF